jgi:putative transposase
MKYAFIRRHQQYWPIRVQCRILAVSVSGYHQHVARKERKLEKRHLSNEVLLAHIRTVYEETKGAYGWPRIWRALRGRGIRVSKERVQRLMQAAGIRARGKRRFRIRTTDSEHTLPIAPNRLQDNLKAQEPNQLWSGDITYIGTEEGWLFLTDPPLLSTSERRVYGSPQAGSGGCVPPLWRSFSTKAWCVDVQRTAACHDRNRSVSHGGPRRSS